MRLSLKSILVLTLIFGACGCGSDDSDNNDATVDVTGVWDARWYNNTAIITLAQSGNQVVGTFNDTSSERASLLGTVSGNTISLTASPLDEQFHAGSIAAVVTGDSMSGTATDNVTGTTGPFTATRR